MSSVNHVCVLVNSYYDDAPYDRWVQGSDVVVTLLVTADRVADYRHIAAPHRVLAFENYRHNGNVERAALELHAERPFTAVIAKSEPDILRAARLRELMGVRGQNWQSAVAFRDKLEMKRRLSAAGIRVPEYAPLACGADLVAFVAAHGYPVVVKPVLGSGSFDTCVLRNANDLERRLNAGIDSRFEAETYVAGPMYIVDGLVIDGRVRFRVASRYVNDCLSFQRGEFLGIVLEPGSSPLYSRLVSFADQVLAALPLAQAMTFHLEAWHAANDELVFCEVASRTGGLRHNEMIAHAHGVDMDRAWFCAQVGLCVDAPLGAVVNPDTPCVGHMAIYPGMGVLSALPTTPPPSGVVSQHYRGLIGESFRGGYKSGDCLAAFVISASGVEQIEGMFKDVAKWFAAGSAYVDDGKAASLREPDGPAQIWR